MKFPVTSRKVYHNFQSGIAHLEIRAFRSSSVAPREWASR